MSVDSWISELYPSSFKLIELDVKWGKICEQQES